MTVNLSDLVSFLNGNPLAFDILGLYTNDSRLTLADIARSLRKRPPSVHRVLQTLIKKYSLIQKESSGNQIYYVLVPEVSSLVKKAVRLAISEGSRSTLTPNFMFAGIERRLGEALSKQLDKKGYSIIAKSNVQGEHFVHQFDFVIFNKESIALELIIPDSRSEGQIFQLVGRMLDIPRKVVDGIIVIALGHLPTSHLQYLKELNNSQKLKNRVIFFEQPIGAELDPVKRLADQVIEALEAFHS